MISVELPFSTLAKVPSRQVTRNLTRKMVQTRSPKRQHPLPPSNTEPGKDAVPLQGTWSKPDPRNVSIQDNSWEGTFCLAMSGDTAVGVSIQGGVRAHARENHAVRTDTKSLFFLLPETALDCILVHEKLGRSQGPRNHQHGPERRGQTPWWEHLHFFFCLFGRVGGIFRGPC